jgi:predicted naringenin-chalcone synthase
MKFSRLMEPLEHASASVGMASGDISITLTVAASCSADATRIGVWMIRAAAAASGLDALSYVRADV